jgi:hypothetical protein
MDKIYDKPTATHIVFYSQEEITAKFSLPSIHAFGNDDSGMGDLGGSDGIGNGGSDLEI